MKGGERYVIQPRTEYIVGRGKTATIAMVDLGTYIYIYISNNPE